MTTNKTATYHKITVNRKQTIGQAIDSLGYDTKYINSDVAKTLKNKGPKTVEVEMFTLGKEATNEEVRQEYDKRGLVADPFATIALLKKQPALLEEKKYIVVQLEGNDYIAFGRWLERYVYCRRLVSGWFGRWWFAGRKISKSLDSRSLGSSESLETWPLEELEINGVKYRKV